MNKLVSVIIPCYNQAEYLGEAIESVLRQTHGQFEIIVVDDGSRDRTGEVAARYPGVRLIRQERQGQGAARNAGLAQSNGSYVVFLDADDRLLPTALSAGLECLEEHPECAFVLGRYRSISSNGIFLGESKRQAPSDDHYLALLKHGTTNPAAKLYRRTILQSVGGFVASIDGGEDWELDLRIAQHFPIRPHNALVAEYRRHDASFSTRYSPMLQERLSVLRLQSPYVRGNRAYERAQRAAITWHQRHYGEPLVSEAHRHLLAGRWLAAGRALAALMRCYPRGILKAFWPAGHLAGVRAMERAWNALRSRWRQLRGRSTGAIAVHPDPLEITDPRFFGAVTLSWTTQGADAVEVHVGAPDGPLFSGTSSSGNQETGLWVHDGMEFYLQDVSDGLPLTVENTLASVCVKATVALGD